MPKPKIIEEVEILKTQDKALDDKIGVLNGTVTTQGQQIGDLYDKSIVAKVTPSTGDWNTFVDSGYYTIGVLSQYNNTPVSIGANNYGGLVVIADPSDLYGARTQTYACSNGIFTRNKYDTNTWQPWKQIATTETLNERGYLDSKILRSTNLNTIIANGFYIANSHSSHANTNVPTQGQDITYCIHVMNESNVAVSQIAYSSYPTSINTIWKRGCYGGSWTAWAQIATTEKTEILFPYNSGYSDYDAMFKTKITKSNNLIIISLYTKGTLDSASRIIGVLPVGYRPSNPIEVTARTSSDKLFTASVNSDGNVVVTGVAGATATYVSCNVSFFV